MPFDIDPAANAFWIANNYEAKRYDYPELTKDDTVIDLGAYQGHWGKEIHNRYGCKVIMVEPVPILQEYEDKDWCTVIHKAAGVDDDFIKFGGNGYWTNAFEPGSQVYPSIDVLSLIEGEIGLLKINIEGMEYQILNRILRAGCMHYIKYLQVQFHEVNVYSQLERINIRYALAKTHSEMWNVPFVWESWKIK